MGSCSNKIEVEVSIEKVWETIKDFHEMPWASDVITSVTKIGNKSGNKPGAKRILNDAFYETLISVNPDNYSFSYSIDDGPGPISSSVMKKYVGVVSLTKYKKGTIVEWSSTFTSDNDDEVIEFCNPIYAACLQSLKKHLKQLTLNNFYFK